MKSMRQEINRFSSSIFIRFGAVLWKKLYYILLFFFIMSIFFNFFFFKLSYNLYKKLQYSRIFPLGYSPTNRSKIIETSHIKTSYLKFLFVGDSRAQMWDTSSFPNIFQVSNIAHGGQTSTQVLMQLLTQDIPDCDCVIIQVGINDIYSLGAFSNFKSDIIANLETNLSKLSDFFLLKNKKVIFLTLFPPSAPPLQYKFFWDAEMNEVIQKINQKILNLCKQKNVFLIDAYKLMANTKGVLKPAYRDLDFFLHVNKNAYEFLNRKIVELLPQLKTDFLN